VLFGRRAVLLRRHRGIVLAFASRLLALVFAFSVVGDGVFVFVLPFHTLGDSHGVRKQFSAMIFENRNDAGKQLAARLTQYAGEDTRILALPRGGVPVAYEVAMKLHAPLDVFVVRKLGAPGREELAIGAIASAGIRVLNEETIAVLGTDDATIEAITRREIEELSRREAMYRDNLPAQDVSGRTVILIDDGLATGASMQAAIAALRRRAPRAIIGAVPVAPAETCTQLARYADVMVCVATPRPFRGVGAWYSDFRQVTDEEVRELLVAAAQFENAAHDRRT
jgi:putative phosphoribosyl transferase